MFLAVPILILFATVMPNIFKYMWILLKLLLPVCIYRQPFNKPNLIYTIVPIKKVGFEDLIFVISSTNTIFDISKTMIFINLIDETTEMVKYL